MERRRTWAFWIAVALMLIAVAAYLASLDESEPLDAALSGRPGAGAGP
ncbi:MAG: hypothetical protein PHN82_01970 [bacterium]|nr:hypothetical protein [bacterium]